MQEHVCNYALIRFLPYRDSGEFVNVGVVMACAGLRYFDFRTEAGDAERILNFFPDLDSEVYRTGLKHTEGELLRWKNMAAQLESGQNHVSGLFDRAFSELIRHRQDIFFFSEPRTILARDPDLTLDELFTRHVQRLSAPVAAGV